MENHIDELLVTVLLLAVVGGLAFCPTMNIRHASVGMGGMANCSMAHLASILLPPPMFDKGPIALIAILLLLVILSPLYRTDGDLELSSIPKTATDSWAVHNPFLEVMRRGIIHPKLYNPSSVS